MVLVIASKLVPQVVTKPDPATSRYFTALNTRGFDGQTNSGIRTTAHDHARMDSEGYHGPLVTAYARTEGAAAWALEDAERYDRFELLCEVRSAFAARPWIEVIAVRPHLRSLTEGVVLHAARGCEQMAKGAWDTALDELRRASLKEAQPQAALDEVKSMPPVHREPEGFRKHHQRDLGRDHPLGHIHPLSRRPSSARSSSKSAAKATENHRAIGSAKAKRIAQCVIN